jgi:signal transduction histidine kinase
MYSEDLLQNAMRLKFPGIIEREFLESHFNAKAYNFITKYGLIPAFIIVCCFWAGDYLGFTHNLHLITIIRIISLIPLVLMYLYRKTDLMYTRIRDISAAYIFYLACSVLAIVAITPDSDFAHRGYVLSFPMIIFIMFLAKPRLLYGLASSLGFTIIMNIVNIAFDVLPLGFNELISHIHINLVMLSSIIIGAITCYTLEVSERREFIQKKIIEQERESVLLQRIELAELVDKLQIAYGDLADKNLKLDSLNKEKDDILGIAAHDLKNPLSGIAMSVSVIRMYGEKMKMEEIKETMQKVEKTVARMRDIISNLLNLNSIETGKIQMHLTECSAADIAEGLIKDYSSRARGKYIEINHLIDQSAMIYADPSMTYQIMENLLSNAMKFSPENKQIMVLVDYYTDNTQKKWVKMSVKDQGPGLTEQDKSKLFGKFQKLSARPTGGENSTGLGLSIVKKLVELQNGKIMCESQPGMGAEFIVLLPCAG